MTVDNPNTIDFVTLGSDGAAVLVMVEHRPWDGTDERLYQLQEKINRYAAFALDGELVQRYPELSQKPVRLELRYETAPDAKTAAFFLKVQDSLAKEGLTFRADKMRPRPLG
jgi:Family of unknown function (DUF6572)